MIEPTHPHAKAAVNLATMTPVMSRAYITYCIQRGDCPRSLYVLACLLKASRDFEQKQLRPVVLVNPWLPKRIDIDSITKY